MMNETNEISYLNFRRYTAIFAEKSKSVIAVDFMQKFLNKNMENNCKFNNIDYMCSDVTKLQLLEQRYVS